MRDGRVRPLVLAGLAVGPALVMAVIVLVQAAQLRVPSAAYCRLHPYACVRAMSHARTNALTWGWVGVLLVLALGLGLAAVVAYQWRLRRRRVETRPTAAVENGRLAELERERAQLVRACMEVSDDVGSGALRERLADALADAGVTPIVATRGERFDSSRHHAVGSVPTRDTGSHNLVAETERPGYVDRGRRLRYPDVLVFNADGEVKR